jgi:hypothetical protein
LTGTDQAKESPGTAGEADAGRTQAPQTVAGNAPDGRGGKDIVVSAVIVVYKTPDFLRRCLDALAASRIPFPWEAIVIDNAPRDGDCASIARGRPGVTYVPNARNIGFGRACNQGMRLARGRYYLVLNPDVEVTPGNLEALVSYMEREPDAGMVAPRLHYGDGTLQESCRTFYTLPIFLLRRTFLGRLFPNSRLIRRHLMRDWDHEETRDVDWCLGACVLVRREAVQDVGMMDERFFMYFEDVDWCYRMHQRGWRVVYHPQSRMIHHYQRASAGWKPSRGLLIHLGSTLRYYEKWSFVLYWLKLRSRSLRALALFLSDLVMVVLAFLAAYALRSQASGILTKPLFAIGDYGRFLVFTAGVAMASFTALGLYRERMRPSWVENGLPVAKALLGTSILVMAATFLFSVRYFSRVIVLLFFPFAVVLVTLGRVSLLHAVESVRRRDLNLRRVGLLGSPEATAELLDRFDRYGRFGMEPVLLPHTAPEGKDPAFWMRRLRAERVQELVLFEDWVGDVPGLLREVSREGMPVRLVPRLREVLPLGSSLGEFMGWPAVRVATEGAAAVRSPSRRLTDTIAALALGVLLLVPYLLVALARLVTGRRVLETRRLIGSGGRPFEVRCLAGEGDGRGFWRAALHWYPALPSLASGKMSLVGIYPFPETTWIRLDPARRSRPPEAPAALIGPWTSAAMDEDSLLLWNRAYLRRWSAAEDFRIFWKAALGIRDRTGGKT